MKKKLFGLSLKLVHLDINEILTNYRNPKFWKKKWLIFKTKNFDVIWRMTSISIDDDKISSIVEIANLKRKNFWSWSKIYGFCKSIPLHNEEYTQKVFERNLLESVKRVIDDLEKTIVRTTYEYKEAEKLEFNERAKLEEIANNFLDTEGVTNKDIRDAYIDSYVWNTSTYHYTNEIVNSAIRRFYPNARLLLYSWFDNKTQFEEESKILKEQKGIKKNIMYDIWKSRKELDGEDFIKEAENKLGGI